MSTAAPLDELLRRVGVAVAEFYYSTRNLPPALRDEVYQIVERVKRESAPAEECKFAIEPGSQSCKHCGGTASDHPAVRSAAKKLLGIGADFWCAIPCGHPPDPVAARIGSGEPVCHCGRLLEGAPAVIVHCQACDCHVLIPEQPAESAPMPMAGHHTLFAADRAAESAQASEQPDRDTWWRTAIAAAEFRGKMAGLREAEAIAHDTGLHCTCGMCPLVGIRALIEKAGKARG